MEIGLIVGGLLCVGGLYELFRKKKRAIFPNSNFIVFYDNFGQRHMLRLNIDIVNRNNSPEMISNNTKEYISTTNMGLCTISQEEIVPGSAVRELNCGHYFKKEYIDIWLSENNICPMCRKNFKIKENKN